MNEERSTSGVKRRGFIGAGVVAAGAALGAFVRRSQTNRPAKDSGPLDSRFAYDVSEFERTDPGLLRYKPTHDFKTGFTRVTRIAASPRGIWVSGDESVKLFSVAGERQKEINTGFRPHCLEITGDGLIVGAKDYYAVFGEDGKERFRSEPIGGRTYFTSVCAQGSALYAADAASREVLIFDRRSGEVIDRFGKKDPGRNNPGFAIPSPYFHLEIASDNRLRIANTGQTRIETYTLDGRFESAWGKSGMQIDGFCGCCNPAFFTIADNGNFITSEKGLCRINIYSPAGAFINAVAGPETLVQDKELARRACVDCTVGGAFDVAVDTHNNVFALDPFNQTVRCFTPLNNT